MQPKQITEKQQAQINFLTGYILAYANTDWFSTSSVMRLLLSNFCIEEGLPLIDAQTLLETIQSNPCYAD